MCVHMCVRGVVCVCGVLIVSDMCVSMCVWWVWWVFGVWCMICVCVCGL